MSDVEGQPHAFVAVDYDQLEVLAAHLGLLRDSALDSRARLSALTSELSTLVPPPPGVALSQLGNEAQHLAAEHVDRLEQMERLVHELSDQLREVDHRLSGLDTGL